jgi:hypothetical protein
LVSTRAEPGRVVELYTLGVPSQPCIFPVPIPKPSSMVLSLTRLPAACWVFAHRNWRPGLAASPRPGDGH